MGCPEIPDSVSDGRAFSPSPRRRVAVIGVDRVDPSKDLLTRLQAFDLFLERFPAWRGKLTWWEFASPSRLELASYREHFRGVREEVLRFQKKWESRAPRSLLAWFGAHSPKRLEQAYASADLAWVTPRVDGMNLVCQEYVLARGHRPGELILTEGAGASEDLRSACLVPSSNPEAWAAALAECLARSPVERAARWDSLRQEARARTAERWGAELLRRTVQAGG